jgi:uncharacterized membrane protein
LEEGTRRIDDLFSAKAEELSLRFARGEIDKAEFEEKRRILTEE